MAQDRVSLFNLALSIAGSRGRVSTPDENSREAEICRQWFDPIVRQILRAAPWGCAKATANLALLKERSTGQWLDGEPSPLYQFAYAVPANCLRPRYLQGFQKFELGLLTNNQQAIMTNAESALLYYTLDQQQISMWDSDLYLAVAHALGASVCLPLSGKPSMARGAQQQANIMINVARENSANESHETYDTIPVTLQARNSAYGVPTERYVYPNGASLLVTNG